MAGTLLRHPEMREVVSRCLSRRQLWVNNLSEVTTQWFMVDSNLRPSGYKAHKSRMRRCGGILPNQPIRHVVCTGALGRVKPNLRVAPTASVNSLSSAHDLKKSKF